MSAQVGVINNRPQIIKLGEMAELMPGFNLVDEVIWKSFTGHPVVVAYLKSGVIELKDMPAGALPSGGSLAPSLKAMDAKAAVELIQNTYRIEFLREWVSEESRATVLRAINAQIEAVSTPPKAK